MTLHLIQKSPFSTSVLADCLNVINADDIILLMQDGVYACKLPQLSHRNRIVALQEDLDARGIKAAHPYVEPIDYAQFVTLCSECSNTISWY